MNEYQALMTQRELCNPWQVREATLERWRSEGIGPPFVCRKIPGNIVANRILSHYRDAAGKYLSHEWDDQNKTRHAHILISIYIMGLRVGMIAAINFTNCQRTQCSL
jgi:site-specific recombinase XerC